MEIMTSAGDRLLDGDFSRVGIFLSIAARPGGCCETQLQQQHSHMCCTRVHTVAQCFYLPCGHGEQFAHGGDTIAPPACRPPTKSVCVLCINKASVCAMINCVGWPVLFMPVLFTGGPRHN